MAALVVFLAVFFVVWAGSIAWVIQVFLLLGALGRRHAREYARILDPIPRTWTVVFNPFAVSRVFAFVLSHHDAGLGDPQVSRLSRGMRVTLAVVAGGWVTLLVLLAATGGQLGLSC